MARQVKQQLTRQSKVQRTPRFIQTRDKFGIESDGTSEAVWDVDLALPADWNVGLIVGPSGAGKTTLARQLVKDLGSCALLITPKDESGKPTEAFDWPGDQCVVDGFPEAMGINDVTQILSSVGFSSPPSWLQPFHTLSIGEQFRATVARVLAECQASGAVGIIDEFANNVDVTAARIGSAAIAKAVRRGGLKLIAVTCREDVGEYLEPDWIIPVTKGEPVRLVCNKERGLLRRPDLRLEIVRTDRSAWSLFRHHHYLSHDIHNNAQCFVGLIEGGNGPEPAAFCAAMHWPTTKGLTYREHRCVCLPAYQGIGVGNIISDAVAAMFVATGRPYFSTTSHPAFMRARAKSKHWRMVRRPSIKTGGHAGFKDGRKRADSGSRVTCGFQYIGPVDAVNAKRLRVLWNSSNRIDPVPDRLSSYG
jgi:ABC-type ATPase involved in cell division